MPRVMHPFNPSSIFHPRCESKRQPWFCMIVLENPIPQHQIWDPSRSAPVTLSSLTSKRSSGDVLPPSSAHPPAIPEARQFSHYWAFSYTVLCPEHPSLIICLPIFPLFYKPTGGFPDSIRQTSNHSPLCVPSTFSFYHSNHNTGW